MKFDCTPSLLPDRNPGPPQYTFSDDELARMLEAADRLATPNPAPELQNLHFTGGRNKDAAHRSPPSGRLRYRLDQGLLTVGEAKCQEWRQLPLQPSTAAGVKKYSSIRDAKYPHPKDPAVFVSARGARLISDNASQVFTRLARRRE